MSLPVRAIREPEVPEFERALGLGFGGDPSQENTPHFEAILERDRTRCAFDGEAIVGTSGAFSFDLTVPGGALPTAGTTMVSVRATHRRRGILRAMMRAHLEDVREHEEPLAVLWASESSIYPRFGYGPAAYLCGIEIERTHGAFRQPLESAGRLQLVDADRARKLLPQVYETVLSERPGCFTRSPGWWEHRRLVDLAEDRHGASEYRYAVYEESGQPRGYAQYRIRQNWPGTGLPGNSLDLVEMQGADVSAEAALWRYLLDVDLNAVVRAWNRPLDDPLPWLLADSRRALRSVRDSLWLRVIDVPAALEGRSYAQPGTLCFELHDRDCPWNHGVFVLEADADGASCRPSSLEPEIRLGVSELGALYLGGNRFAALARAGRIVGDQAVLRRADAMFAGDVAPWCPEIF